MQPLSKAHAFQCSRWDVEPWECKVLDQWRPVPAQTFKCPAHLDFTFFPLFSFHVLSTFLVQCFPNVNTCFVRTSPINVVPFFKHLSTLSLKVSKKFLNFDLMIFRMNLVKFVHTPVARYTLRWHNYRHKRQYVCHFSWFIFRILMRVALCSVHVRISLKVFHSKNMTFQKYDLLTFLV